jgi:hypothetical protein
MQFTLQLSGDVTIAQTPSHPLICALFLSLPLEANCYILVPGDREVSANAKGNGK